MQTTNTAGGALSAEFTAACTAAVRTPAYKVYVKWDGANWVDESLNVISFTGNDSFSHPDDSALLGQGTIDSATVILMNRMRRYSRLANSGFDESLTAAMSGRTGIRGIRVKIYHGFEVGEPAAAEYVQKFYGVIYDWEEDSASRTFSLYLRDNGNRYLQKKANTPLRKDYRLNDWIIELAGLAGIAETAMDIDPSIYSIPWAWADDESAVDEMWKAAQADGGRLYWDHHGVLRFENILSWAGKNSVWTFTEDHIENLRPRPNPDMLATEVQVEWQPRQLTDVAVVWQLDERKIVQPGETISFEARTSQPVWSYFTPQADDDYHFISSGGGDMNQFATVTLDETERYAQSVTITLANNHNVLPIILVHMELKAVRLQGGPSQSLTVVAETSPLDFTHRRTLRGNVYVQTDVHARALATFLAERNSRLTPIWTIDVMRPTPALELGDRVTFSDNRIVASPRDGHVISIAWDYGEDGFFSQTVEVIDREYLFPYEDYFIIGTDSLGTGRAWY